MDNTAGMIRKKTTVDAFERGKQNIGNLFVFSEYLTFPEGARYGEDLFNESRFGNNGSVIIREFKKLHSLLDTFIDICFESKVKEELYKLQVRIPTNDDDAVERIRWFVKLGLYFILDLAINLDDAWLEFSHTPLNVVPPLIFFTKYHLDASDIRGNQVRALYKVVDRLEHLLNKLEGRFDQYHYSLTGNYSPEVYVPDADFEGNLIHLELPPSTPPPAAATATPEAGETEARRCTII